MGAASLQSIEEEFCALAQVSDVDMARGGDRFGFTRAELDSHANMVVLGKQCTVIRRTGKVVNVNAFASEVGSLKQVPIVDAAIVFGCHEAA